MVVDYVESETATEIKVGTDQETLPLITIEREGQRVVLEGFIEWVEEQMVQASIQEQLEEVPISKRHIN